MLYFIDMISGKDFDHQVRVIKIGFTKNLKKRLSTYYTHNGLYEVVKVLKGKEFDWECEQILHSYFADKRYDRREFFVKDEELMKIILGIKTRDDIMKLKTNKIVSKEYNIFYKKYKGILLRNWESIEKLNIVSSVEDLVKLILSKTDYDNIEDLNIFDSVEKILGIKLQDYSQDFKNRLNSFLEVYDNIETRQKKLKYLCENFNKFSAEEQKFVLDNLTEIHFQEYIEVLGLEECKAQAYNTSLLNKKMNIVGFDKEKLKDDIYNEFKVGQAYPNAYSKQKLGEIYNKNNFRATPKACDLREYFDTRPKQVKVKDDTGKWVNGIYIISKKTNNIEFDKEELKADIFREFIVGNYYSTPYIKQKLWEIYNRRNYKATAKASDLNKFFDTKHKSAKDKTTGKWVSETCIVSKK